MPDGPAAFVTPGSTEPIAFEPVRFRGVSSAGGSSGAGTDGEVQELYFPEPYNDEQVTIVEHLERAPGVTVQGPPGTGKTHTIANIVCHYLATGRRVLVTSAGEPALRVLQNKIPEEVRALTVALLTGDREGQKQFEGSIRGHPAAGHAAQPGRHPRAHRALPRGASTASHAEIHAIDRRVDEIALAQLSEVEVDGQPMRADRLAERVVGRRAALRLVRRRAHARRPPCAAADRGRGRAAARRPPRAWATTWRTSAGGCRRRRAFRRRARSPRCMPRWCASRRSMPRPPRPATPALKGGDDAVLAAARALLARLAEARDLAEALESQAEAWPLGAAPPMPRARRSRPSAGRWRRCFPNSTRWPSNAPSFLQRPVSFPAAALACADTRARRCGAAPRAASRSASSRRSAPARRSSTCRRSASPRSSRARPTTGRMSSATCSCTSRCCRLGALERARRAARPAAARRRRRPRCATSS